MTRPGDVVVVPIHDRDIRNDANPFERIRPVGARGQPEPGSLVGTGHESPEPRRRPLVRHLTASPRPEGARRDVGATTPMAHGPPGTQPDDHPV